MLWRVHPTPIFVKIVYTSGVIVIYRVVVVKVWPQQGALYMAGWQRPTERMLRLLVLVLSPTPYACVVHCSVLCSTVPNRSTTKCLQGFFLG